MLRKSKAQSTLEYIVVLTVIIGAVIAFVAILKRDPSSTGVGQLLKRSQAKIESSSQEIVDMTK
jgi:hypothetical protein